MILSCQRQKLLASTRSSSRSLISVMAVLQIAILVAIQPPPLRNGGKGSENLPSEAVIQTKKSLRRELPITHPYSPIQCV
jgi:hypothetical protein